MLFRHVKSPFIINKVCKSTMPSPEEILKPLCWLIGKWVSVCAEGFYPTIKSFQYMEELEFKVITGQPILNFSSKTWMLDKKPMHFESGFLRIKPGTNEVALMASHNRGLTSLEEGVVNDNEMCIKSTQIASMKFVNKPDVCTLERHFKLTDCTLKCVLSMATTNTPLTEHLRITYEKQD